MNNGNGFFGGLQFVQSTWEAYGGKQFADRADLATKEEQIKVATALFNKEGPGPWPTNGWVLKATDDQLKDAGLTSTGRRSTSSGNRGGNRNNAYGTGAPQPRVPYGLPVGSNSGGYGGSGVQFPEWTSEITRQFGVKPSTYPGHQEGSGQNKGIDWKGTPAQMRQLAEWAMAHPDQFEQLIYWDPETGKKYGLAGGQPVGPGTNQPGYYANDWADHGGPGNTTGAHVHTRQSYSWGPQYEQGGGDMNGYTYDGPGGSQNNPMYVQFLRHHGRATRQGHRVRCREIFGLGTLFKDPTQFGLFKIFKSIMGLGSGMNGDTGALNGSGNGGNPLQSLITGLASVSQQPYGTTGSGSPDRCAHRVHPGHGRRQRWWKPDRLPGRFHLVGRGREQEQERGRQHAPDPRVHQGRRERREADVG